MHTLPYLTLDRDVQQLRQSDVAAFAAQIRGGTLGPADDAYNEARKVWNGTIDRRPALIARCLTDSDVQAAVRFAALHRMLLSVRGGGHHIAGNAIAEGGLMLDLSELLLTRAQSLPTRHGETTRQLGLPACRALIAFGLGNDTLAITLLASLPALAHRLGGSHAQRDVLNLTLLHAIERIRRPARRLRIAPPPIAAYA